jgi:hypothetical protein
MKLAPTAFVEQIRGLTPPGSEVIPLEWTFEDEDYNIAVLIDDGEDARQIEERLLDTIIDYDEAHGTFTVCMVWHKQEKGLAGVR